jgi:hypothetical protein
MTEIQNPKLDEILKSHFSAWIPAFAGMTHIVSIDINQVSSLRSKLE